MGLENKRGGYDPLYAKPYEDVSGDEWMQDESLIRTAGQLLLSSLQYVILDDIAERLKVLKEKYGTQVYIRNKGRRIRETVFKR